MNRLATAIFSIIILYSIAYAVQTGGAGVENPNFMHFIDFHLTESLVPVEGRMGWDTDNGTVTLGMPGGNVNLQLGQEELVRVRNETGVQIDNGKLVYISGASGNKPLISLADADVTDSSYVIGWATEDISHNDFGYVTTAGLVRELDTSGCVVGNKLYLSQTAGDWQTSPPVAPAYDVFVGICIVSGVGNGVVYAHVTRSPTVSELSNVYISGLADGHILKWVAANNRWENAAP